MRRTVWRVAVAATLSLLLVAVPQQANAVTDRTYELVSPDDGGADVFGRLVSDDGTRVLMDSTGALSSADMDGGAFDVYLRADGQTQFLSPGGDAAGAAAHVFAPAATADLRHVAMVTKVPLLGTDMDAAREDVYENFNGQLGLVSAGGNGAFDAGSPFITSDGTRIFFETAEPLLPGNDGDTVVDAYSRFAGVETRIVSPSLSQGNGPVFLNAVTPDGAAFMTTLEQMDPGDTTSPADLDVYERFGDQTTQISVLPAVGDAVFVGASADATKVVYRSTSNKPPEDTDGLSDLFLRQGSQTTLLTPGTTTHILGAVVSRNADHVFFATPDALDPVADTDTLSDIYERSGGETRLVSAGGSGAPFAPEFSGASPDGTRFWFRTREKMSPDDTDGGAFDVYERSGGQTRLISGGSGPDETFFLAGSDDGSRVVFSTTERLAPEDTDDLIDVYERAGGALNLVSPAAGGTHSANFSDLSPDGRFLLFTTDDKLSAADTDSSFDVYLARVPDPPAPGPGPSGPQPQPGQPVPETPGFGAATLVDLVIGRRGLKPSRTGVVSLPVRNRNAFVIRSVLGLRSTGKIETSRKRVVNFGSKRATLGASRRTTVKVKLSRKNRAILRRRKRVTVKATLALTDPRGQKRTVTKTFRLHAR